MDKVRKNLVGEKFGRLTVLSPDEDYISHDGHHYAKWLCKCDCGSVISVRGDSLKNGRTKSCGCLTPDNNRSRATHGDSRKSHRNRLYTIWANIMQRCKNPKNSSYKYYGDRGIRICEQWERYEEFKSWALADGYSDELTIDRTDFDGDYCPENCRWISIQEQQNNKRTNHSLTYNGKTMSVAQWSRETGMPYRTLMSRVYILRWDDERAITTPVA